MARGARVLRGEPGIVGNVLLQDAPH
jgi:hypothetical protein